MKYYSIITFSLVVLLAFSFMACQRNMDPVLVWGNGTAEGFVNGKPVNDPDFILRPAGYPLFNLRSYATQYVGADSSTNNDDTHIFRRLYLSMHGTDTYHLGDFVIELENFTPGSKSLQKFNFDERFHNYSSFLHFGGGLDYGPAGFAVLDESKPYSVVIDRYDPVEETIEGRLDVHYKLTKLGPNFGLDSSSISRIQLSEAKFKAKIRKRNQNGWLDEQL